MIWRLTYCNKKGVEARVDIIKGDRTSVEIVKGSANPFAISYKLDKNDKSGHIMTSSADIEIFETETFNIDDLKTSNETELKVEYFEGNVLTWAGFILPDFFSREIGSPNIVRMTASDRLTALKGVTLSDLPIRVSLRDLIELSLEQTGLSLALVAQVQINQGSTNILDTEILSQRLTDTRGRSISCYDVLMSIMVATNSTIRQRKGQWIVYNKLEHELRTPTIFFDKVERGAIRTIQPVASSVGVYQEFGGNRLHPNNYDFSNGLTNWTPKNGFEAYIDNRVVSYFLGGTPIYQPDVTTNDYLVNFNDWITNETNLDTAPFLESNNIPIASTQSNTVEVEVDISAVMAEKLSSNTTISFLRYAIIATNEVDTYALTTNGVFETYDPEKINEHSIILAGGQQPPLLLTSPAYTNSSKRKGVLEVNNVNDFHINIRIYGSGLEQYVNVNFASVRFSNKTETPKGNLYKTIQGSNYTKLHDVETVIFGDYIRKGLNGYFYDYPIDETSNLYLPNGELASPTWITIFDTTERPLLHHISRQKSRLFSIAHDILRANIDVESFDPLAVFQDCKGGTYVVVSANFDFLRSEVNVELEQIAYDNTILKRDFIYSYFGEGENNIKSIGGIAGGGGGAGGTGGGGMTSEQLEMLTNLASWWKLDEDNDAIYSEKSVYSLKEVSAYGLGSQGGGSGGTTVTWGATVNNYSLLTVEGEAKNVALSGHKHAWGDLVDLPDTLSGYGITDAYTKTQVNQLLDDLGTGSVTSVAMTVPTGLTVTGSPITTSGTLALGFQSGYSIPTIAKQNNWDDAYTNTHTHSNKTQIDLITQAHINVLNKLFIDAEGNVYTTENFYSTKEVSAYGLGSGGGGGTGYDRLDAWADYATGKEGWVLSALLGVDLNNRLSNVESGSATSITTTGSGNAITSVSKSGNTLTFTKGSTFSLSTHTHTIAQITGLQGALDSKATQSDIDAAIDAVEIGGRNLLTGTSADFTELTMSDTSYYSNRFYPNVELEVGETYTFTFLIEKVSQDNVPINVHIGVGATTYQRDIVAWRRQSVPFGQRVSLTHTVQPSDLTETYTKFAFRFRNERLATVIRFKDIKLEKGTKATDWSPAPEDQVSDWNETNVGSFSYIKNKPTQLSQFIDNIGVANHIANKANPHNVTTSQIGAVDLTTNQTITGAKTFNANITLGVNRYIQGTDNYTGVWNVDNLLWRFGSSKAGSVANIRSEKVGIGTDSPLYKLDVAGTGRFTGDLDVGTNTSAKINMGRSTYNYITTPTGGGLSIITNGDSASALNSNLIVSPNGNVGVGKGFTNNTTSITAQLHVRGNILATGEVTAYVASDRRLKENIRPITSALDYINRLNPVTYNWNAKAKELNSNKPNGLDYGLIAQEVESVLPNIVHGIFDDKYKSIDYTKLIPIMIGAIKELKQEINKLKN